MGIEKSSFLERNRVRDDLRNWTFREGETEHQIYKGIKYIYNNQHGDN